MDPIPSTTTRYDNSALCKSCGLCCDSLFTRVRLSPDDQALARDAGVSIIKEADGSLHASLPCAFLRNAVCTVYPDRYAACRTFTCKLLRAFTKGEVDAETARARVVEMRERLTAVRVAADALDQLTPDVGDADGREDMIDQAQRREAARLRLVTVACNFYANIHFRNVPDPRAGPDRFTSADTSVDRIVAV